MESLLGKKVKGKTSVQNPDSTYSFIDFTGVVYDEDLKYHHGPLRYIRLDNAIVRRFGDPFVLVHNGELEVVT